MKMKNIVGAVIATWIFLYIIFFGRRPTITPKSGNTKLLSIISQCHSFSKRYWPLMIIFGNNWFQLGYFLVRSALILLFKKHMIPKYTREVLTMTDGQTIALDWVFCNMKGSKNINIGKCSL